MKNINFSSNKKFKPDPFIFKFTILLEMFSVFDINPNFVTCETWCFCLSSYGAGSSRGSLYFYVYSVPISRRHVPVVSKLSSNLFPRYLCKLVWLFVRLTNVSIETYARRSLFHMITSKISFLTQYNLYFFKRFSISFVL